MQAWNDAARLADRKWDKVMDEVWPEAQARSRGRARDRAARRHRLRAQHARAARPPVRGRSVELAHPRADQRRRIPQRAAPVRALGRGGRSSGRARSGRAVRQLFRTLPRSGAQSAAHDLIFVSQVLFGSGRMFDRVDELAALGRAGRAVGGDRRLSRLHGARRGRSARRAAATAFYLGGGYKYAMAGEGCAFMHAPPGFGPRPRITGWFAEFEDLSLPPGQRRLCARTRAASSARPSTQSALYRFIAVRRMLAENGLDHGAHFGSLRSASAAAARRHR